MQRARQKEDIVGFVWRSSKAKKLIVQGRENGEILNSMSPEEIFDKYNESHPQYFQFVGFRLFKGRLKALKERDAEREEFGDRDAAALAHDRQIYPMNEYNSDGEPIWRKTSKIRKLLVQDIADNKHKTMTPEELWESREEYQKNDLTTFRNHIYSIPKSAKFHKWCEDQRDKNKL
jgi:hypothetical protein